MVVDGDNIPLIGASVFEEGTENGTTTDLNGHFSIEVSDQEATLVFAYTGVPYKRIQVGKQTEIKVKLKGCNRCWFDAQEISFSISSGILNSPIGGRLSLSSPRLYRSAVLRGGIAYQTDLKENHFLNANLDLIHLYSDCDFDANLGFTYRKIDFQQDLNVKVRSIDTDLNFRKLTLLLGYSKIDVGSRNKEVMNSSGIVIGLGKWFPNPLAFKVSGKVSIYKGLIEYYADLSKPLRRFYCFVDFYKIRSFTEVSVGVGSEISYLFKSQRD